MRGPEAVDAPRAASVAGRDDLVELGERVVVELARGRMLEDRREAALQVPGVEEELPVDVADELGERGRDRAGSR